MPQEPDRTQRYKVTFPTRQAFQAALAAEAEDGTVRVVNPERLSLSLEQVVGAEATSFQQRGDLQARFGARVRPEVRYEMDVGSDHLFAATEAPEEGTLDDVLRLIRATDAWSRTRGDGVTIAIVDTGVDGTRPEFGPARRVGQWAPLGEDAWTDWKGHGSMCAAIAVGSRADGGAFDGVAPGSRLISCRTSFFEGELAAIYDFLTTRAAGGETIVASNSFGMTTGTPPQVPAENDFIDALDKAVAAGVHVFFSAGNNHDDANGDPGQCGPNTVWLHKSRADVLAVATCDLDERMWYYSSRGPGQHFGDPGTNGKPDVTAPTPRNGKVVYGGDLKVLPDGWGTSGACPQAAGLAALLLSLRPDLPRGELFDLIRGTAKALPFAATCCGTGLVDCASAVERLLVS